MADLNNQNKFNKTLSFFIGVLVAFTIYSLSKKEKIIVVDDIKEKNVKK